MTQSYSMKHYKPSYGSGVYLLTFLIAVLMSPVFYFLFNNYAPANFMIVGEGAEKIYIIRSEETIERLKTIGVDAQGYDSRLKEVKGILADQGYDPNIISEKELITLKSSDTLFLIDAIALSDKTTQIIEKFVESGGSLIFNYYSGYSGDKGAWRGDKFIRTLTKLSVDPKIKTLKKQQGVFLTPKLLSPITGYLKEGPLVTFVYYDDIPLFISPDTMSPDLYLTDWSQFSTPKVMDLSLPIELSGASWHGYYGKGNWVYFNFPSYVLTSSGTDDEKYKSLFRGIVDFTLKGVVATLHPYLNDINPVFISEDTEFRFENAKSFSDLIQRLEIPSTAFCVAMLAERNPDVTKQLAKNPFIELGSHSYSHGEIVGVNENVLNKELIGSKEILENFSKTKIGGFRPPREEIDDEIAKKMVEGGYTYTMEKNKNHLYPTIVRKNIVVISRVGTDDYGYMANHSLDEQKILEQMKREELLLRKLNGIYTLSLHTHLFSDPNNIHLVETFLRGLKEEGAVTFVQGKEITDRVRKVNNIDVSVSLSPENYLVSVINNNPETVKSATIRLYWPRFGSVKSVTSNTSGVRFTIKHNLTDRFSDITLLDLQPRKQLTLLATYTR